VSAAVYSGLTVMPSGVTQFRHSHRRRGRTWRRPWPRLPGWRLANSGRCCFVTHGEGFSEDGGGHNGLRVQPRCGGEFTSFIIIDSKYSVPAYNPAHVRPHPPPAPCTKKWPSLRQRIFRRELEPGSWIDELKIAEEYGISRTPLREALKVLAAEGLVTMKVRRGAYVTEMSEKDLRDVYHLLSLLESDAAGVVATTATPTQLQELQGLHAELEAAVATATASLPSTSAFTCACWRLPTTAGAPDGGRPAQGDEAQPPQLAAQAGAHRGVTGRAPRHHGRPGRPRPRNR
jgi:DNA-binding transcriptional regulator YhcF (GntR family)